MNNNIIYNISNTEADSYAVNFLMLNYKLSLCFGEYSMKNYSDQNNQRLNYLSKYDNGNNYVYYTHSHYIFA